MQTQQPKVGKTRGRQYVGVGKYYKALEAVYEGQQDPQPPKIPTSDVNKASDGMRRFVLAPFKTLSSGSRPTYNFVAAYSTSRTSQATVAMEGTLASKLDSVEKVNIEAAIAAMLQTNEPSQWYYPSTLRMLVSTSYDGWRTRKAPEWLLIMVKAAAPDMTAQDEKRVHKQWTALCTQGPRERSPAIPSASLPSAGSGTFWVSHHKHR